jgi:MFS family permease
MIEPDQDARAFRGDTFIRCDLEGHHERFRAHLGNAHGRLDTVIQEHWFNVIDLNTGQHHAGAHRLKLQRLPILDPGNLKVGQINRVVDMLERVEVTEANLNGLAKLEHVRVYPSARGTGEPFGSRYDPIVNSTFRALEVPEYRRFWISQLFSLIGSWLHSSAQAWLVLQLFSSSSEATFNLGLISALQWLPSLLLSLFAGAVLDRVSRRATLITSQITLLMMALALGTLVMLNAVTFERLIMIALISGLANVFDIVARQSLIPQLVPRAVMPNAVALNSLAFNLARVLGGSLFGVLAPFLGLSTIFFLNATSFLGVLFVLIQLKVPKLEDSEHGNVLEDIRVGLRYVLQTPVVRGPILLLAALSITVINYQVIIPTFAKFALSLKEGGFGLLGAAFGIGAALGAVLHARSQRNPNTGFSRVLLMQIGSSLTCLSLAGLALSPNLWLASLALVISGTGMILFTVSANSSVQLATPDRLRGRVMSIYTLVFAGMSPVGALVAGGLMAQLGPRVGVLVLAVLGLLAVLVLRPREARPEKKAEGST